MKRLSLRNHLRGLILSVIITTILLLISLPLIPYTSMSDPVMLPHINNQFISNNSICYSTQSDLDHNRNGFICPNSLPFSWSIDFHNGTSYPLANCFHTPLINQTNGRLLGYSNTTSDCSGFRITEHRESFLHMIGVIP